MITREVCIMETDRIIRVKASPKQQEERLRRLLRILLLRHGEPLFPGKTRRFLGSTDVPLSPRGREQAEAMRFTLRDLPLSRIITSPLRRASETASLLAAGHSSRVETVEALREIHLGTWENRTFDDVAAAEPELFAARGRDIWNVRPPKGESFRDAASRALPAFTALLTTRGGSSSGERRIQDEQEMRIPPSRRGLPFPASTQRIPDEVILFVGHAGIFRLVLSAALRIPLEATFRMEQDYCGIHVLEQRELLEEGSSPLRSRHQETEETVPAESENPAFSEKMSFRLLRLNWNTTLPEA